MMDKEAWLIDGKIGANKLGLSSANLSRTKLS